MSLALAATSYSFTKLKVMGYFPSPCTLGQHFCYFCVFFLSRFKPEEVTVCTAINKVNIHRWRRQPVQHPPVYSITKVKHLKITNSLPVKKPP